MSTKPPSNAAGESRILIKGARVIDMAGHLDPNVPQDVLVVGENIAATGTQLSVDAHVIDGSGMILLPGFVDTHRHTWETQLRALCGDWTLGDYARNVRLRIGSSYEPEDVYIGNYVGAIEAINAGVTTVLDFSHIVRSPEHADAALAGLRDSGVRALFCYGFFPVPGSDPRLSDHASRIADLERIAALDHGPLIEIGAAMTEIDLVNRDQRVEEILAARRLGLRQVFHTGGRNIPSRYVRFFEERGLLGDDQIHVHCNELDPDEWLALTRAGCKVSISPETELNMGMGFPVFEECRKYGILPTLSCDITALCSGEMFTQMRMALAAARHQSNLPDIAAGRIPKALQYSALDALQWATINGADALGLRERVGSVEVGKSADLVLIRTDELGTTPMHEPAHTALFQASPASVDTVIIAGSVRKRHGQLVGVDVRGSLDRLQHSTDELKRRAGVAQLAGGEGMI